MSAKKYQVFVSSTFRDLVEERQDAVRNILNLKQIPAGMELFPASDIDQLVYIKKVIDECDYYVLIMGGRYGSMDAEGISYTEREYDYAVDSGKIVLAFVHADPSMIPVGKSDTKPEVIEALKCFRQKVMTGRLVSQWSDRASLQAAVIIALNQAFSDFPMTGWIRGNAVASEGMLEQSNKLLQENIELKNRVAKLQETVRPSIPDIADLSDVYELKCQFVNQGVGMIHSSYKIFRFRWSDLFLCLATELNVPKNENAIVAAVTTAARLQGVEGEIQDFDIIERKRLKAQFIALNLIEVHTESTEFGHTEEVMSLTDYGRATYIESLVVRKSKSR